MSPNTTPIEPSARSEKCPVECAAVSPPPVEAGGGATSFEIGWDMRIKDPEGAGSGQAVKRARLYSLTRRTERAGFALALLATTVIATEPRSRARATLVLLW